MTMKILVVAPNPFFSERGTPIAVRMLCEALCDAGHSVDLLTYHVGSDVNVSGLTIFRIPAIPFIREIPIGLSWRKLICDIALSAKLLGRVIRDRYDVIHAVEESIFPSLLVSRLKRITLIYDMDSSMPDQMIEKWRILRPLSPVLGALERLAIRGSDGVIAVCDELAVRAHSHDPDKRVTLLYDPPLEAGPDDMPAEDLRRLCGIDGLLLLYVGNLERYQGIDLLLEGFARAKPADKVHLVIIGGESGDVVHYRARAAALGLGGSVDFLGPRPVGQLSGYLEQASMLVSPRLTGNNTPMKIYSYLASGKPVLATDIVSHSQVMDETCAVLVEPTPEGMATGIERLASDGQIRARLGKQATDLVRRKYSRDVFRKTVLDAYSYLEQGVLS